MQQSSKRGNSDAFAMALELQKTDPRLTTVYGILTHKLMAALKPIGAVYPDGVSSLEAAIDNTRLDEVDACEMKRVFIQEETAYVKRKQSERVGFHRKRLANSGMIVISDESSQTGQRNVRINNDDRHVFESILLDVEDLAMTGGDHDEIDQTSVAEMMENTVCAVIADPAQEVVGKLVAFVRSCSVHPSKNGKTQVIYNKAVEYPQLRTLKDRIDKLTAVLVGYNDDPYLFVVQTQIMLDKTLDVRINSAIDEFVMNRFGEQYEVLEHAKRMAKKLSKLGRLATNDDIVVEEFEPEEEPEIIRLPELNAPYERHKSTITVDGFSSIWGAPQDKKAVTVLSFGQKAIYIAKDYDPQLAKLAVSSRKKHPTAKDKIHPYDRLIEKAAEGLATGALPAIYDGSAGNVIGTYARSAEYEGLELRYCKSRAHNSSRVYYVVKRISEVVPDISGDIDRNALCMVVIAETDKANESAVIVRIRGRDMKSARRGIS